MSRGVAGGKVARPGWVPVIALLLVSCAAPDPLAVLPAAHERLEVQYSGDNSKFFEFTREHVLQRLDDDRRPLSPDVLSRRVEAVLEQTGYCRDGFFELYRQRIRQGLTLRGECREAATREDRAAFSDGEVIYRREP
ncbi:MAG: hypothetical protein WEB57_01795 [Pseudohongiellaceae bacterium]